MEQTSNLNSVQKILSQTLKQSTISINGKGDELRESFTSKTRLELV